MNHALEQYDIAVVGAGIAGLYCCSYAPAGLRMALFEATDRFGGKIETLRMEGFQAEYGAMRFDPSRQHMMGKLVTDMGLETEPFPEYSSPPVSERRMSYVLKEDEKNSNALELFARGVGRILNKSESELLTIPEEELEHLRRWGKHRNKPLWQQGLWNMLADVLSYEAITYIMFEGSFFHGIHENPGAAGTMITWVKMLQMSQHLKGIRGGMQKLSDGMLEKAKKKGVEVYTRHLLKGLVPSGEKRVRLIFDGGEYLAKHVILALPAASLEAIKGIPEDIRVLLGSVIKYPLLKCFFVVKDPWWEEDIPNRGVQALPARELHYYRDRRGEKGNIMVYADRPYINFWNKYVMVENHHRAEIGANEYLPLAFAARMKISPGRILSCGIRDWVRNPYGAGVHLWKAGVEPWKISPRLEAFALPDSSHTNIHICGEAFSDYQAFMEGAIRSADSALNRALSCID